MLCDLLRQLASRGEDQRDLASCSSLEEFLEQWNAEGRGLAAAGWSAREDVVAGQSNGDGRSLDRCGLGIVKVIYAATYGSI